MSFVRRMASACSALLVASLALAGCALQADWDGSKRLASDECVLAAQLFGSPDRTALAEALRPHVPEDMHVVLDIYALPALTATGDESEQRQAEIIEVLGARSLAEDALRGWAQLSCGAGVGQQAGEGGQWPMLSQMQAFESEHDGVRIISVAGALEPDHAVALCAEVRMHESEAQIEVSDFDGFPLAFASPGAECYYDPILLQGLDLEEEQEEKADEGE